MMIAVVAYGVVISLISATHDYREKTVIASLADQYSEIARNLPYARIGTISGNPPGLLPDYPNAISVTVNGDPYKIYYVVNYVDDSADGTIGSSTAPDLAPNDYKQVKLYVKNVETGAVTPFVTNIVSKGLENLANGGALSIQVFNAVGQPVPGASIHITNNALSPHMNLTRTTDGNGNWIEVGLPDSVSSYHVVASKSGYSTDQTYPSSGQNPNPVKPDATISNGQVTQVSFSIDHMSSLVYNLVDQSCGPISGVGLEMRGSKIIGTPNILKFDTSYSSDGNGQISIPILEWDNYVPAITTASYTIYGSSPIQQISILPGTNQQSTLILGATTAHSALVIVKDASTGNPIKGATVTMHSDTPSFDSTKLTEGSIWTQQDWSGGGGQTAFTTPTMYYADDGNVDVDTLPIGLRLKKVAGDYVAAGSLESSTFDTGTAGSSYTTLNWQPTSQGASTTLQFQIATNNDNATWNYLGPDGTPATYYTVPGTSINATTTNTRYVRYKAYLSSTSTTTTPVLSNVNLNYVSGCAAPGQAMFPGLQQGQSYQLTVSDTGYTTQVINNITIGGYNVFQVSL